MIYQENELIEISKNKKAICSSVSVFSLSNPSYPLEYEEYENIDTQKARLMGWKANSEYTFYSAVETNPWWMLDLENCYDIECIFLENTFIDPIDFKNIRVHFSIDNHWTFIDPSLYDFNENNNNLTIHIFGILKTRYVKISFLGYGILKFKTIKIFKKKKYGGLLVSSRIDNFGMRMLDMIVGMYLAEKLNFKFSYYWQNGHFNLAHEQDVFSEDFIENYSIKNNFIKNHVENNVGWLVGKCDDFNHLNRKIKFNKQYSWGCITPNIPLGLPYEWIKECDKDKNLQELKNKYAQIQFCDDLKKIINEVENIYNIFNSNFIALHIRSGDVTSLEVRKLTLSVEHVTERYFPYEIAYDIIIKNIQQGKIIIIFGDNEQGNKYLYDYVCKKFPNFTKSIFLSDQFAKELNYTDFEKAFFDLNLMSKAEKIIGPGVYGEKSGFSKLATIMSGKDIYNTYHNLYSDLEQYNIIKNNIGTLKNQHHIKSYAYIYLYHLGCKINSNKDTLIEYLKIAYKLDKDNVGIKIHYLDCLFNQERYNELNFELSEIIKKSNFISLLLSHNCLHYKEQVNKYLYFKEKQKYPYISFIAAHVAYAYKDIENAKLYCSYAISNNNDVIFSDFYNYLNQNNIKSICMTTEVERIKNQLSYRLGNTLVKHPFTFIFRAYGIYKKWKKEKICQ